jgi:hypothetical protein
LGTEAEAEKGMSKTDTEITSVSLRTKVEKWVISVGGDIDFVQSDSRAYKAFIHGQSRHD